MKKHNNILYWSKLNKLTAVTVASFFPAYGIIPLYRAYSILYGHLYRVDILRYTL